MQIISLFAIIFSISLFSNKLYALDDSVNKTDFFPIGVYYIRGQKSIEPLENDFRYNPEVTKDEYLKEFQDLKSYGFNTAILMINPLVHDDARRDETAKDVINGLISAAEDTSMQLIVPINQTTSMIEDRHKTLSDWDIEDALSSDYIDLFMASNAVLGYQIFDEPNPNEVNVEQLGQINNAILELNANSYTLSTWNNAKYMRELNEGMNPDVLLINLYPFAIDYYNGDQSDSDTPFGDLSDAFPRGREDDKSFNLGEDQPTYSESILYAQNIAADKPVWVAFQAFGGDTYWRDPIPKELRLQAFIAIKNGAKGLFYFMYQSEDWASGMMNADYEETSLILEAKEINQKINALAPTLLKLSLIENYASSDEAEVQTFVHENGEKYLIAVNTDIENTNTATIFLDKDWLTGIENTTDIYTHENFTIDTEDEDYIKLTLPIEAADGRVILLEDGYLPHITNTTVTTDQTVYSSNETITVTYTDMSGNEFGDWLAIFPKNATNTGEDVVQSHTHYGWYYTKGETSGQITFSDLNLANLPEGEYEVRAFFNDSYHVEASYPFFIQAE